MQAQWGCGEIGSRRGLKIRWSVPPYGFESLQPHFKNKPVRIPTGFLIAKRCRWMKGKVNV